VKELHATASSAVDRPAEECFTLLADVERYPAWCPDLVPEVEVLDRDDDGQPRHVRATLHVSSGPLVRDFRLRLAVVREPPVAVRLTRIPHDRGDREEFDVSWRVEALARTRIQLKLDATLSVPRLLPIGGVGDSIATGMVAAAARALSQAGG
jgi:ribosome-associated toxin RatA of RatAB toxin-antitoxin module